MENMENQNLALLRRLMSEKMEGEELKTFCFTLSQSLPNGVRLDYDNLSGNTKDAKIVSLLDYLQKRTLIPHLFKALREFRPDIMWGEEVILLALNSANTDVSTKAISDTCNLIDQGLLPIELLLHVKQHPYWLIRKVAIKYIASHVPPPKSLDLLYEFRNTSYHISQQIIRNHIDEYVQSGLILDKSYIEKAILLLEQLSNAPKASDTTKDKNKKSILSLKKIVETLT